MTIFVNYRRKDSEAITGRIGDRLAEHFGEKNVYRDVESIPVGVDFVTHLESAIAACKVFVVVIGPDWVSDRLTEPEDFVRLEIETALRRRIPIVPVLVEGAMMPTKAVLPESLRPMVRLQGVRVDAGSEFGLQMTGLLSDIENVMPPTSTAPPTFPARRTSPTWPSASTTRASSDKMEPSPAGARINPASSVRPGPSRRCRSRCL